MDSDYLIQQLTIMYFNKVIKMSTIIARIVSYSVFEMS